MELPSGSVPDKIAPQTHIVSRIDHGKSLAMNLALVQILKEQQARATVDATPEALGNSKTAARSSSRTTR